MADCCKYGDVHLGSIKCGKHLDQLRNYQLLKNVVLHLFIYLV
jgi:hypothetical protein